MPRIASFAAFATRNLTTRFAGILIDSPVAGFLPILALRLTSTSFPNPGIVNVFFASLYARFTNSSTKVPAVFFVVAVLSVTLPLIFLT